MAEVPEAWLALIRAFGPVGSDAARVGLTVLGRIHRSGRGMTMHELGLIMDELESGEVEEDIWDLLVGSGMCDTVGPTLQLSPDRVLEDSDHPGSSISVAEVMAVLVPPDRYEAPPPSTAGDLTACVRRVERWAETLLRHAADEDLAGFPVFWQRDDGGSHPLGRNVGSMAATDTVVLALEPTRFGWPSELADNADELVGRAWHQLLDLGIDHPDDWYDGAIAFTEFDDDFVGSFLPAKASLGSCPTTEAIANRASGLIALLRSGPTRPELAERTRRAIDRAVLCLVRWQDDSGGWANHRYPPSVEHQIPIRDASCQYAVDALVDALHEDRLSEPTAAAARQTLQRFADHLVASSVNEGGRTWWLGDFVVDDAADRLRTTTLVGLVIGKVADILDDGGLRDLQSRLVATIESAWTPQADATFESTFRSPTWDGAALSAFTWDMVRDAFVVAAVLDHELRGGTLSDELAHRVQQAVDGILGSEFDGSWLDVPMAREGRRRAFVSNTLHTLRAVLSAAAWVRRSLPSGIGPGW